MSITRSGWTLADVLDRLRSFADQALRDGYDPPTDRPTTRSALAAAAEWVTVVRDDDRPGELPSAAAYRDRVTWDAARQNKEVRRALNPWGVPRVVAESVDWVYRPALEEQENRINAAMDEIDRLIGADEVTLEDLSALRGLLTDG